MTGARLHDGWAFLFFRFIFWVGFRSVWRMRVEGAENIPRTGGVIIAPNHVSLADPPVIGAAVPRSMHFMAKQELFDARVLGWFMPHTNSHPVRRGAQDVGAIRTACRLLRAGAAMLIFPEGTRSRTGDLGPAKPGLGMIAAAAGVPVIPVRIFNTRDLMRFGRVRVVFGAPLAPPAHGSRESYESFSQMVVEAIRQIS